MRVIRQKIKSKILKSERGSKRQKKSDRNSSGKSSEKLSRSNLKFVLRRLFSKCARFEKELLDLCSRALGFWRRSSTSNYITYARFWRGFGAVSFAIFLVLSFGIFAPYYNIPEETEALTSQPAAATTTLTLTNAVTTAAVDLSVTSANGNFATSSSNIAFGVKTDNYTGYTVSLSPKTSNTDLTNNIKNEASNSYATFTSISSGMDESTFSADTAAAGEAYNGKWGVKPSKYNSTVNSNYLPSPTSSSAMVIDKTTVPNASAAVNYTIGIGARAGYGQAAGTYANTYVLTVTGNEVRYTLTYNNPGNAGSGFPSNPSATSTSAAYITLSSTKPTRTGYTFAGWCTVSPNSPYTSCSGDSYAASGKYYLNYKTDNSTIPLYAYWTVNSYTVTISNSNTTTSVSSLSIPYGGSKTVTVTPSSGYYLSGVTCPSGYTCSGYSTGSSATGAQTVTVTNNNSTNTSNTLSFVGTSARLYMQTMTADQCTTSGVTAYDSRDGRAYTVKKIDNYCIMTQNLNYIGGNNGSASAGAAVASDGTSFTMTSSTSSSYTAPYYYRSSNSNYGAYYNYCAASGKQVCTDSTTTGTTPATVSICPSGWKLPTSDSSTSFGGISTNSLKSSGNLAVYAGFYGNGTLGGESSLGLWWSATAHPSYAYSRCYLFYNTSGSIDARSSYGRANLLSVRCIKS